LSERLRLPNKPLNETRWVEIALVCIKISVDSDELQPSFCACLKRIRARRYIYSRNMHEAVVQALQRCFEAVVQVLQRCFDAHCNNYVIYNAPIQIRIAPRKEISSSFI